MSGSKPLQKSELQAAANDTRLRYHLTSLYGLRPIPDDLMELVQRIGSRAAVRHANDAD
jgi:hypothetical protein